MTLHQHQPESGEVGVRELHDRLSEYLERVEGGGEIVVTRRGRPVARLSGLGERPLEALTRRGLVRMPQGGRSSRSPQVRAEGPVHLATALELGDDELVVVTWDRDLARATEEVGLGLAGSGGEAS